MKPKDVVALLGAAVTLLTAALGMGDTVKEVFKKNQ